MISSYCHYNDAFILLVVVLYEYSGLLLNWQKRHKLDETCWTESVH